MFGIGSFFEDCKPLGAGASSTQTFTINTDATTTGVIIDTQGYKHAVLVLGTGVLTAGDIAWHIYHDDAIAMGTEAEIAAADYNGDIPDWTADADDQKIALVDVILRKRYLRIKIVSTNSANVVCFAHCILAEPMHAPAEAEA